MPLDARSLQETINLAHQDDSRAWVDELSALDDNDLRLVLASCHSTGARGALLEARREALVALLEERRLTRLESTLRDLSARGDALAAVGNRLALVGIVVSVAAAFLAALQWFSFSG